MALSDYSSHDWRKFTDDAIVVDDKNNIVGSVLAVAPTTQQPMINPCNIPINLNYQAQAITSS